MLDGIAERNADEGAVAALFGDCLDAPFQRIKFTEDVLFDQYIQHTTVVEDEINQLVTEARALFMLLQKLENRFNVIHGIAVRENLHAEG